MLGTLTGLYRSVFGAIERLAGDWFVGFAARFTFLAVLFFYYLNSAMTKIGDGVLGFFQVQDGAYFQIVPSVVEAAGYDTANVPFIYDVIVYAGTYTEILLPILIVLGLFTRGAALAMIGFIAVQSYVDVAFHGVDDKTIGALFDRASDSLIADQRMLWVFLLLVLVVQGAGRVSLDHLLSRRGS